MSVNKVILSFNWTKVELKLQKLLVGWLTQPAFNWTKVELKHGWRILKTVTGNTFNWTKVELKQHVNCIRKQCM